eukprot:Clim_evm5s27 gene=Clim_evmTU5s27
MSLIDFMHSTFLVHGLLYNLAFEDPEQDQLLLNVKSDDVLAMITTGGCNVLDRAVDGPKKIITCDLNFQQNHLMSLRLACARVMTWEEMFECWGKGKSAPLKKRWADVKPHLNHTSQAYWEGRLHFVDNFFRKSSSGKLFYIFKVFAILVGINGLINGMFKAKSVAKQQQLLYSYRYQLAIFYFICGTVQKYLAPFGGVPQRQYDMLTYNVAERVVNHVGKNVVLGRDAHIFYAYWHGQYTVDCCPRYLSKQGFAQLKENLNSGKTVVEVYDGLMHEVLDRVVEDGELTIAILLDHMDWLDDKDINEEFKVFVRKMNKEKGRIMYRTAATSPYPRACLSWLEYDYSRTMEVDEQRPCQLGTYGRTFLCRIPKEITTVKDLREQCGTIFVPQTTVSQSTALMRSTFWSDFQALKANFLTSFAGAKSHKEKMDRFYDPIKFQYDGFRERMLHGRPVLMGNLPSQPKVWYDIGGGTARNIEFIPASVLKNMDKIVIVDICEPLLEVARTRVEQMGISDKVELIAADICAAEESQLLKNLPEADLITFSYSLTMIPQWKKAMQWANSKLCDGGRIGVTDFTVRKPVEQTALGRWFWTNMFAQDNVHLTSKHHEVLEQSFRTETLEFGTGGFPYVPMLSCWWYVYVGQKISKGQTNLPANSNPSIQAA